MRTLSLVLVAVLPILGACSEDRPPGNKIVSCRHQSDADGNSDCVGRGPDTRKLDCDNVDDAGYAMTFGCELQDPDDPGDYDVCCPTNVRGTYELSCTEPADMTDSDCAGTDVPRKLDCTTLAEQEFAFMAGCTREHPDDPSDFDVCCPAFVRGVP